MSGQSANKQWVGGNDSGRMVAHADAPRSSQAYSWPLMLLVQSAYWLLVCVAHFRRMPSESC